MKHLLSACKINQCDNKLVVQIIVTWFEIDRTDYISYLLSIQSLHHRGWPCETTSARSHTCTASVSRCMTLFARTQYDKNSTNFLGILCNKFPSLNILLQIFCRPATPINGLNLAPLNLITTALNQSTSAQPSPAPSPPPPPGQLVYDLNLHPASDSRARVTEVRPHTFVSPSAD